MELQLKMTLVKAGKLGKELIKMKFPTFLLGDEKTRNKVGKETRHSKFVNQPDSFSCRKLFTL